MVQTIQAKNATLLDLETRFGLQFTKQEQFFREWQDNLPDISDTEKQRLDRIETNFSNLLKYPPTLENTVKMVVLGQFLDLADFYQFPLHIKSEASTQISAEDKGILIRGDIDVLVLLERLWLVVIESKKADFSLDIARPQILAYMLSNPHPERPSFGLIVNGSSFRFLKLVQNPLPQYAMSRIFDMFNPGHDLYDVLRILKRLKMLAMDD
ncbi:MAG: restriction endonuclease subunit R [Coleofasciculus sp. C1-SOL-03]|uniref:type I restriction endonuclease n=1 Tax=Coleofasciculus sp. C1-SOL-03 TaxID=3069522 RepID=UPI0033019A9D